MGHDNNDNVSGSSSHPRPAVNSRIMIAAIVVLFIVVVFIMLLHVYARWFWRNSRLRSGPGVWSRRRRRFSFSGANQVQATGNVVGKGLEKSVIDSLPIFYYTKKVIDGQARVHPGQTTDESPEDEVMDCAVCLSEFEENEAGRKLPRCGHVFHTDCIDMWFGSHSTCPLCRASVVEETGESETESGQGEELLREAAIVNLQGAHGDQEAVSGTAIAIQILQEEGAVLLSERHQQQQDHFVITIDQVGNAESGNQQNQFPASVLFWGNQTYVNSVVSSPIPQQSQQEQNSEGGSSSKSKKQLLIEVPRRSPGNFSPACSSQLPSPTGDGQRSPLGNHLRNLKRLLSRDSRRSSLDAQSPDCCDQVSLHSACHTPVTPRSGCQTPC